MAKVAEHLPKGRLEWIVENGSLLIRPQFEFRNDMNTINSLSILTANIQLKMLPSKMNINKKLLPMKGHFFFFNAGTAPLVPYLSTYARQLGFSSATVGLIYTVLPIFGLIAKPLFGVIADRFKKQKSIFILFQIITIVSFSAIYLIPENTKLTVELHCNGGVTMLQSCYNNEQPIDQCKLDSLNVLDENAITTCRMNCDMNTPKMWQTVCEHWHIPEYCYSNAGNIQYTASVGNVTYRNDNCIYIAIDNVTMDDHIYRPNCRLDHGYVDLNEPCSLTCDDPELTATIGQQKVNMTCINQNINYRLCSPNANDLKNLTNENIYSTCQASCDLDGEAPWRLMEICDWWNADTVSYCQAKTQKGEHFPANLSFNGILKLSSALVEHNCLYIELKHIEITDDNGNVTIHYPVCNSHTTYQLKTELFNTSCEIDCDHMVVNELIKGAMESDIESNKRNTAQFWMFFTLMIISWIGQAVVVTFADAICFDLLGVKFTEYGKQRLWGSVGWGVFSLLTGVLIDLMSEGAYKDYTIAFILMFVFMMGDVCVSCFLKTDNTKMSLNILADVGTLLSSVPTFIFLIWTVAVGMCTGLLWQFLFWLLEDTAGLNCEGGDYVKTLQGLVSAIQTFGGEIPFLFVSGYIIKKVGHVNMMSIVLLAFGIRFILYSFLTNAWWVLPIELFQGITFGMFYPTMTSYANIVSPTGTETTVQGLVGAIFEGVGTSLGSFIGGTLYETYGGWITFRSYGIGALVCCAVHALATYAFKDRFDQVGVLTGFSSFVRYEHPNDLIYMMEDLNQGKS